jgi:poly-gamma-glutamate capsule biosynthesis protein CapA/YwtB (metallophosphatase superfamily)
MRLSAQILISSALLLVAGVIFLYFRQPPLSPSGIPSYGGAQSGTGVEPDQKDSTPIRVLFGGDMMFDRWIREKAMKRGNAFVFDGVRDEIRAHDLTIANLEGPITDKPSKSIASSIGSRENYIFTFDPSWASTLAEEGIGPVSLGNNHILNQGQEGIELTKGFLEASGVPHFGDPTADDRVSIREIRGTKIAFVSYDEFVPGGKEHAFDDIAKVKSTADIVIMYAHWGSEYLPVRDDVRSLAHAFVDAGCDTVIGSHPHVVQESETYAGKTIYYSLGNFVFDQYEREDTKLGILVSMTIDPTTKILSYRDIPIELHMDGGTTIRTAAK